MRSTAVFLLPAVVGGGLGDIDEVLVAGQRLKTAGFPIYFFRRGDRPPLRGMPGPWRWPPRLQRVSSLPAAARALTVAPSWGVSAAPRTDRPLGAPGPWADEAQAIEARYGVERTLHVSLEEFARLYTSDQENRERYREGGWSRKRIEQARGGIRWARDVRTIRLAYRRFRGLDRKNVVHCYGTFAPSRAFVKECPEAVLTGPLWPVSPRQTPRKPLSRGGPVRWVWYASPSTSDVIVPDILRGFSRAGVKAEIIVRSPRPLRLTDSEWVTWRVVPPTPPRRWDAQFRSADVRIVTGSRTLLEALHLGRPFLYFNGVTGRGRSRRRHRPEKLDNLLQVWPRGGRAASLRSQLRDFARARRVRSVVAEFALHPDRFAREFRREPRSAFSSPFRDQGAFLVALARRWDSGAWTSSRFVELARRELLDLTPRGP